MTYVHWSTCISYQNFIFILHICSASSILAFGSLWELTLDGLWQHGRQSIGCHTISYLSTKMSERSWSAWRCLADGWKHLMDATSLSWSELCGHAQHFDVIFVSNNCLRLLLMYPAMLCAVAISLLSTAQLYGGYQHTHRVVASLVMYHYLFPFDATRWFCLFSALLICGMF